MQLLCNATKRNLNTTLEVSTSTSLLKEWSHIGTEMTEKTHSAGQ